MKTKNTLSLTSNRNNSKHLGLMNLAVVISIGLGFINQPALAETSNPINQSTKSDPVKKPADGKGKFPTFTEADKNGDHVVTKNELQNFPYMLQVFDKVDAGENGKLEQHEYQNLEMETKREGEVR